MKALVTTIGSDKKREKKLVTDWPDAPEPVGNQVKVKTLYTAITNGTERNDLICGNYARPDTKLPAPRGYQNIGEVIAVGDNVQSYKIGDVVFSSSDHLEYATFAEDWLTVKVPNNISCEEASLFGLAAIAVRTCRNSELMIGEKVLIIGAGILGLLAG
ncbi:MAG: alcohol dehydrogenase catalytic domain-containing protein, partial [Armatimonadota bacterium]